MDNEEEYMPDLTEYTATVGGMIEALQKLDPGLPVFACFTGWVRPGEYFTIGNPILDDLKNQDTSGDPEYYGPAPVILIRGGK